MYLGFYTILAKTEWCMYRRTIHFHLQSVFENDRSFCIVVNNNVCSLYRYEYVWINKYILYIRISSCLLLFANITGPIIKILQISAHEKFTINTCKKQSSWGQHGAHLGPVGPRWAHVGPINLAIRAVYITLSKANMLSRMRTKTARFLPLKAYWPHYQINHYIWLHNLHTRTRSHTHSRTHKVHRTHTLHKLNKLYMLQMLQNTRCSSAKSDENQSARFQLDYIKDDYSETSNMSSCSFADVLAPNRNRVINNIHVC